MGRRYGLVHIHLGYGKVFTAEPITGTNHRLTAVGSRPRKV